MQTQLNKIVNTFVDDISTFLTAATNERIQAALGKTNGNGHANGHANGIKKARKKPPRQLCPVPKCKNTAAPVFGMVCAKHKDVKKADIKKYREARKAKKA